MFIFVLDWLTKFQYTNLSLNTEDGTADVQHINRRRTKDDVERKEVDLETQSSVLAVVQACHAHVIVGAP